MKRWFYILMGGLGMSLIAGAVVAMVWLQAPGNINPTRLMVIEWIVICAGVAMSVVGFVNGRTAGELDIKGYMKSPRRDHHVGGHEIQYFCPACTKAYRGSPLLVGKKFTCRDCEQEFEVKPSDGMPGEGSVPVERRMLPARG